MAHIYDIKAHGYRIKYRVFFKNGTHKDKVRTAKKKSKAQLLFREASELEVRSRSRSLSTEDILFFLNQGYIKQEEALNLSSAPLPSTFSWNDIRKKYEDYSRTHCRPPTHQKNMSRLDGVIGRTEHLNPNLITEDDVKLWMTNRRKEVKAETVNKELDLLRKLLDFITTENPARKVPYLKKDDQRLPRPFYPHELKVFLSALRKHRPPVAEHGQFGWTPEQGPRQYLYGYSIAAVMICLYAGLRPTEVTRLRNTDVLSGKLLIHGTTKTMTSRSIDINPKLDIYIRSCLRRGGKWLIGGNRQIHPNSLGSFVREVIRKSKLEGLTPYSLRHTWITALLRQSGDIRYTMEMAGHRRLETTLRYTHLIPSKTSPVKSLNFKD